MRAERLSEAFLEIKQEGNAFLTGVLVRQKQSVEEIDVLISAAAPVDGAVDLSEFVKAVAARLQPPEPLPDGNSS